MAAIQDLLSGKKIPRIAQLPTSVQLDRNRCSRSPESVFIMAGIGVHDDRNRCSPSVGIGVHVRPESPFMMGRNTHKVFTIDRKDFAAYRVRRGHRHYAV